MSPKRKSGMSRLLAVLCAAFLMFAAVAAVPTAANATTTPTPCVPAPAWDEQVLVTPAVPPTPGSPAVTHDAFQRYSWTPKVGGHNESGTPDKTGSTPLSDPSHWQANTTDYPGAGHGTDPIGVAFEVGKGNDGKNSSWFFWTKTVIVDKPAVPPTPGSPAVYKTVHHDAVTCSPPPPTVLVPIVAVTEINCSDPGATTGVFGVTIFNQNLSDPNATAYTFKLSTFTKVLSLAGGGTGYFDVPGLAPGHYTATTTGTDGTSLTQDVVIDTCDAPPPPLVNPAPTVTAKCDHCSDANVADGSVTVTVKNNSEDPEADAAVTYSVTLNGVTKQVKIAGSLSRDVTFTGLAPGKYDVTVKGNDGTTASATVTVDKCKEVPPPLPTITVAAKCDHCSDANAADGSATVTVNNTSADPRSDDVFDVMLAGAKHVLILSGGESGSVTFTGLAPGKYDVTVKGEYTGVTASATVTVDECKTPPPVITKVDLPPAPGVTDACPPAWIVPANTDVFKWTLGSDGRLTVTIIAKNTTFKDGSTSHDSGAAPVPASCNTTPPPNNNGGGNTPPPANNGGTTTTTTATSTQGTTQTSTKTLTGNTPPDTGAAGNMVNSTANNVVGFGLAALAGLLALAGGLILVRRRRRA